MQVGEIGELNFEPVFATARWRMARRALHLSPRRVFFAVMCAGAGQEEAGDLLRRARHLESQGHYQEAARIYEDLVRGDPRSPQLLNDLGQIYAHMGKYAEAIGAYRKALKLDPSSAPLLANLGLAYFKSGDFLATSELAAQAPSNNAVETPRSNSSTDHSCA